MQAAWFLFILMVGVAIGGVIVQFINERKLADYRVWLGNSEAHLDDAHNTIEKQREDIHYHQVMADNLGRLLSQILAGKLDDVIKKLGDDMEIQFGAVTVDKVPETVEEAEEIVRQAGLLPDEN